MYVGETWAGVGAEEKKILKKILTWVEQRKEKKVNLSWPPWLTQGQGGTKKVHPSMHHPSTLVHWWGVLVHSGPQKCFHQQVLQTVKAFHFWGTWQNI
jgi:hypothetical protein